MEALKISVKFRNALSTKNFLLTDVDFQAYLYCVYLKINMNISHNFDFS